MSEETFRRNRNGVLDDFSNVCGALFPVDVCFISGYLLSLCIHKYFEEHEKLSFIVHSMPRRNSDVVYSEAYALSHRRFAMQ